VFCAVDTLKRKAAGSSAADGQLVALKRIKVENEEEGFPITAIREIKILRMLSHENIVRLEQVVAGGGGEGEWSDPDSIFLAFEYLEYDLAGVLKKARDAHRRVFSVAQVKSLARQLLSAVAFCHKAHVLHRDLKLANLLLSKTGYLKLADFGLARHFTAALSSYTVKVITLWYRPPELLLGLDAYGPAIDCWSAGCIIAELINGEALMPGQNEVDQLALIWSVVGTPKGAVKEELAACPWWSVMGPKGTKSSALADRIRGGDGTAVDVVSGLLNLSPTERSKADAALDADYFWSDPMPIPPGKESDWVPSLAFVGKDAHEFTVRKAREAMGAQPKRIIQ
jgi:serine/threonine protein kinase